MSNLANLQPLERWQRDALQELLDRANRNCYRYGNAKNKRKLRRKEKPCKRLKKSRAKWTKPIPNHITDFPDKLEMYHVGFMLHFNVQLDEHSQSEICHRCVHPNPRKKQRKALCFEGTHMGLKSHQHNIDDKNCHKVIRKFQSKYCKNSQYRTLGTIYVSDVPVECREEPFKDLVCNHNCFGQYGLV